MHHRLSRLLVLCILLSLFLHFTLGPLLVWLFRDRMKAPPQEIIVVGRSSALRISQRPRPVPAKPAPRSPAPAPQPHARIVAHVPAPRRELVRFDKRAIRSNPTPQPTAAVQINTAQQQELFEKTIAKLRTENDPVLSAAKAQITPEAPKHYTFNVEGAVERGPHAEGLLEPVDGSSWRSGGYDYYYVRYWVVYEDGSTETGIVPWPIRYLPSVDPFRLGIRHIPLPTPMPDYQLPPGTEMHPLVAYCYEHRHQLVSCPIARD